MSDTPSNHGGPCQATPGEELRRQIMSSLVPKNEREHWAARHIEALEHEVAQLKAAHWLHELTPDQLAEARYFADLEGYRLSAEKAEAELAALHERNAQQLAACDCAAMMDTAETHEKNKTVTRENPFWSPAFESVMRRTAECIQLRADWLRGVELLSDARKQIIAEREKVRVLREALEPIAAFAEVFAGDIGSRAPAQRNAKVGWLLVRHVVAAEEALAASATEQPKPEAAA